MAKRFGKEVFPDTDHLDEYLALDDSTILEAIKTERASNEWARRIYERDHLSEAFVTLPHHAGLASYMVLTELIHRFLMKYGANPKTAYVDERARKLPTNPFFGLKREEDEGDKAKRQFASIMVQDKHQPEEVRSICDPSSSFLSPLSSCLRRASTWCVFTSPATARTRRRRGAASSSRRSSPK